MVKTITIIENEDGTQKVILHNFQKDGSEILVEKANVTFAIDFKNDIWNAYTKMNLEIECRKTDKKVFFSFYDPSSLTNEELINELKKRNALQVETVYKIID